jgi:hypothetical protein
MWPTPCSNTRPNEGNVRLLRAKVMAGELSREEAKAMLNGKDPFDAQGVVPAMKWPTPTASNDKTPQPDRVEKGKNGNYILRKKAKPHMTYGARLQDAVVYEENQHKQISGQLNPTWVEWLMGYPTGWTDLSNSETA